MTNRVVHLDDERDRWRYLCPNGHRSWEPTNHHFWCRHCAANHDSDGVFYELRDGKTNELLAREDVNLKTSLGPYDEDIDAEEVDA